MLQPLPKILHSLNQFLNTDLMPMGYSSSWICRLNPVILEEKRSPQSDIVRAFKKQAQTPLIKHSKSTYTGEAKSDVKSIMEGTGLEDGVNPAAKSIASSSGMCRGENMDCSVGPSSLRLQVKKQQCGVRKRIVSSSRPRRKNANAKSVPFIADGG
jgi:hypothetical protein